MQPWLDISEGEDGFPGSSDFAAGGVGFPDWRLVRGPPSEYVFQLLSPVLVDIPPGLPLLAVHGEYSQM